MYIIDMKTNTNTNREARMATRLASVNKQMELDGISGNCMDELRRLNLVDCIGRMRVDPMCERVQTVMRKYHTTLFVL